MTKNHNIATVSVVSTIFKKLVNNRNDDQFKLSTGDVFRIRMSY